MSMRKDSLGSIAIATAVAVTAACCLLFLPRVRAFISPTPKPRLPKNNYNPVKQLSSHDDDDQACTEYRSDGMPILPSDVVQYTQVPKTKFTSTSIPSGLLKSHTTKKGTWGVIRVFQGQLEYTILEPSRSVHALDKVNLGIIEPMMLHQVRAVSDDVEFVVEFWRVPGSGVVDEKREGL